MKRALNNTVMFACNQGGHFSQMMALKDLFGEYESVLVTDNVHANKSMTALKSIGKIEYAMSMANERKSFSSNKNKGRLIQLKSYWRLFGECWKIWEKYSPKVIISTGSSIAVPLFFIGKLKGSKLIFIETRAKVYSKTMTGKLVGKISNKVYVQWPEMLKVYPHAEYFGTLI